MIALGRAEPQESRDLVEKPEAKSQTNDENQDQRTEHDRDEDPVAERGAPRRGRVLPEEIVIARVRFKPKGEGVAEDRVAVLPMQEPREDRAWAIETCPASTLAHLSLRVPYKGAKLRGQRQWIVGQLVALGWLKPLPSAIEQAVLDNKGGDALDSIIAALATRAALAAIEGGDVSGDRLEGRVYFRL